MKNICITIFLNLIFIATINAQECQECKTRRVMMYDVRINLPRPTQPDSIIRWWSYFYLHSGVHSYITTSDPTKGCISPKDAAMYTKPGSLVSGLEHPNLPPAGEIPGGIDYLVYGTVSNAYPPVFTVNLEAGKSRELITSYSTAIPDSFQPVAIGEVAGAAIGPLYTKILNFEKVKRDGGHPYAIEPTITLTPAKSNVNYNEVVNIDIIFMDCDGVPLTNRTLNLTVEGGTLNQTSITTDGDGKATIQFTAGTTQTIAQVNADYRFTRGSGRQYDESEDTFIQINKPNDYWLLNGKFKRDDRRTNKQSSPYNYQSGGSNEKFKVNYAVWVKNMSPVPGHFIMDPAYKELAYKGYQTEYSFGHSHFENEAGMVDDQSTADLSVKSNKNGNVKLTATTSKSNLNFGIHDSTADQTGGYSDDKITWDIINGEQTYHDYTPADPIKALAANINTVSWDTSWTINTADEYPAQGMRVVTSEYFTQKAQWDSSWCSVQWESNYHTVTTVSMPDPPVSGEDVWDRIESGTVVINSKAEPTGVDDKSSEILPTEYSLLQNYPNPFNPITMINFTLPKSSHVIIKVFNLLGQEIITLLYDVRGAGNYGVQFDGSKLPSGMYFYKIQAGYFTTTKKMILAK